MTALCDAKSDPWLREWLTRVYPLYLHELSEFGSEYTLDERGLYQPHYLDYWLEEPHAHPLILCDDEGRPFGFAFVGTTPFPLKSPDVDHRLAEFWVVRDVRGTGRAEAAATTVLASRAGRWEITELATNRRAVRFWQRTVEAFTRGDFEQTRDEDEVRQVFVSPPG